MTMEDIHKRLIRSYLLQINGCYIHHDNLDDCHDALDEQMVLISFFRTIFFFNNALQEAIEQFLFKSP